MTQSSCMSADKFHAYKLKQQYCLCELYGHFGGEDNDDETLRSGTKPVPHRMPSCSELTSPPQTKTTTNGGS